ncbi:diaminopimelate epimerase [Dactylosporangium sp. NPDC051484]|uniref:diaminopimelate epimerase n=1 Tax=Dactylosporangium sp. NPDC051484 TaxID=3154942 RepID=UPI00344C2457
MPEFWKYHALGNDYLVIDSRQVAWEPAGDVVRRLCDRHLGVGADGVLFGPVGPARPGAETGLRIFNSDGSACERSANGIRMFALHLARHHLPGERAFVIRTDAGVTRADIPDFAAGVVRVAMDPASFRAADLPVTGLTGAAVNWPLDVDGETLTVTSLHNGNPHTVLFLEADEPGLAHRLGPRIAGHPRFPARTNVEFVRVADRATLDVEIWERGAGYTLASGSGSWAAASAARVLGLVDEHVTCRMPGGSLDLAFNPDSSGTMTGVIEEVASGAFSAELRARLRLDEPVALTRIGVQA